MEQGFNELEITIKYTPGDYRNTVYFSSFRKNKKMAALMMFAALVLVLAFVVDIATTGAPSGFLLFYTLIIAGWFLFTVLANEIAVRAFLKANNDFLGSPKRYVLTERGVTAQDLGSGTHREYAWENIAKAYETNKYFYLFLDVKTVVALPKSCISPDGVFIARDLFLQKMGKKFEKR